MTCSFDPHGIRELCLEPLTEAFRNILDDDIDQESAEGYNKLSIKVAEIYLDLFEKLKQANKPRTNLLSIVLYEAGKKSGLSGALIENTFWDTAREYREIERQAKQAIESHNNIIFSDAKRILGIDRLEVSEVRFTAKGIYYGLRSGGILFIKESLLSSGAIPDFLRAGDCA